MTLLRNLFERRLPTVLGRLAVPSLRREEGQTLVEYALILVGIAIVVTVVITTLGDQVSSIFSRIAAAV